MLALTPASIIHNVELNSQNKVNLGRVKAEH